MKTTFIKALLVGMFFVLPIVLMVQMCHAISPYEVCKDKVFDGTTGKPLYTAKQCSDALLHPKRGGHQYPGMGKGDWVRVWHSEKDPFMTMLCEIGYISCFAETTANYNDFNWQCAKDKDAEKRQVPDYIQNIILDHERLIRENTILIERNNQLIQENDELQRKNGGFRRMNKGGKT